MREKKATRSVNRPLSSGFLDIFQRVRSRPGEVLVQWRQDSLNIEETLPSLVLLKLPNEPL